MNDQPPGMLDDEEDIDMDFLTTDDTGSRRLKQKGDGPPPDK